jgi:hypothetical protein
LVVIFLGVDLQPKYVPIGLFEANETIGQALAKNLIKLHDTYWFEKKIITYVKDEDQILIL